MDEQLLIKWIPIFALTTVAVIIAGVSILLSKLVGDDQPLYSKLSPYESGNEPEGMAQQNVSVHYSLVAVLFILFDVEIIFMYPWAMTIDLPKYTWVGTYSISVFVLILTFGYIYAWSKGVFEWK